MALTGQPQAEESGTFDLWKTDAGWSFQTRWNGATIGGGPYPDRLAAVIGMLYQLVILAVR